MTCNTSHSVLCHSEEWVHLQDVPPRVYLLMLWFYLFPIFSPLSPALCHLLNPLSAFIVSLMLPNSDKLQLLISPCLTLLSYKPNLCKAWVSLFKRVLIVKMKINILHVILPSMFHGEIFFFKILIGVLKGKLSSQ